MQMYKIILITAKLSLKNIYLPRKWGVLLEFRQHMFLIALSFSVKIY